MTAPSSPTAADKEATKHEEDYANAENNKAQVSHLENELENACKKSEQDSQFIDRLVSNLEKLGGEKAKLQEDVNKSSAKLEAVQKKNQALMQKIQHMDKSVKDTADALKSENTRSKKLQEALAAKETELQKLNALSIDSREDLRKWQAYRSNLLEIDLKAFGERIKTIWQDAEKLAVTYFHTDASQDFLNKQDNWLRQAMILCGDRSLPSIPVSNSDSAKNMRMAVTLAALSSLISRYLLRPTSIQGGDLGLHELLLDKAYSDDKAESLCRALLLSLLDVDDQDFQVHEGKQAVYNGFSNLASQLIEPAKQRDCMIEVHSLLSQMIDIWQGAQRSTVKLDASNELEESYEWKKIPKGSPNAAAGENPPLEEIVLVVFPGVVKISTGLEDVLFPQVVLTKSQILTAEAEIQAEAGRKTAKSDKKHPRARRDSVMGRSLSLSHGHFMGTV